MPKLLTLMLAIACSLLVGCVSYLPLKREQTALISQNISTAELQQVLAGATELASHPFSFNGQEYLAKHYDLLTGTRAQMHMQCSGYYRRRSCMPVIIHIPVTDPYVLIFQQPGEKLIAWGQLEELSRNPDDAISDLMPALKAAYQETLRNKK